MAATPYSGWSELLRTALIMIIVLLFIDLVHPAPQAGSVHTPAEKAVARVGAVLAVWGMTANRLRQRLLLKARDVRKNDPEVDRALNFHYLFLLKQKMPDISARFASLVYFIVILLCSGVSRCRRAASGSNLPTCSMNSASY